jgi:hypothetical protein
MRKYHYEYEVRNVSLAYGGTFLGRYRTLGEARNARAMKSCWGSMGSLWGIRKFRVYDD